MGNLTLARGTAAVLLLASAAGAQPALKDVFDGAFRIGAALNSATFSETDAGSAAIVKKHYNTITPENHLKWGVIHPRPGEYNFGPADRFVEFGEKNKMFIVGHTLVWHQQTPRWVFEDEQGKPLGREALLKRMREHIFTVVGRYRGRVHAWDVVNEAIEEDGGMRQTPWLRAIGEDYLQKAFEYAREADPYAELYYNDFSLEREAKRKGALELVRKLKAAGARVTAVGLQGHNNLRFPAAAEQDATIEQFKALGVKVAITELDLDVLPSRNRRPTADLSAAGARAEPDLDPYQAGLPDAVAQEQARRYAELFRVFLKHRGTVTRVTFWGVTDATSWLNHFPIRGRTNHALLFDRAGNPKPAFAAVVRAAREK
jgi:endo-1,4-beta-xylanase